jgi:type IV pilus assembly protein PilX
MKNSQVQRAQNGVVLIIVLMFIVILSGLAAYSANRAVFGEGQARNQLDVEVATQAAEAALRDAELDLRSKDGTIQVGAACARGTARPISMSRTGAPLFDTDCPTGQCRNSAAASYAAYAIASNATTNVNPLPWWSTAAASKWNNDFANKPPRSASCTFNGAVAMGTFTGTPQLRGVMRQPEYLIEPMARGDELYFRITARGWGLSPSSEVVIQSYVSFGNVPG